MPAEPFDPKPRFVGPVLPPSREQVAQWHREDRCWNCGSPTHYIEACPYPHEPAFDEGRER